MFLRASFRQVQIPCLFEPINAAEVKASSGQPGWPRYLSLVPTPNLPGLHVAAVLKTSNATAFDALNVRQAGEANQGGVVTQRYFGMQTTTARADRRV